MSTPGNLPVLIPDRATSAPCESYHNINGISAAKQPPNWLDTPSEHGSNFSNGMALSARF